MDFIDFKIIDAIDIAIVAILLVQLYRLIRGTAALSIFVAIFLLYVIYIVVKILNMELLSMILGQILGVGALALVVVFQQEIRRYLLMLGNRISYTRNRYIKKLFKTKTKINSNSAVYRELEVAIRDMSNTFTGALIAIEKGTDLSIYANSGDIIDAKVNARLIENIFFKNSPLHDGAMIIRGNVIHAARCILPTSDNMHMPAHMGLRHRAAMGLAEHSDAVVIVVSEETGRISMAFNGEIERLLPDDNIAEKITDHLSK